MPVSISPESEFAFAVYQWLSQVPSGKVVSYGQLAKLAGFPRHSRFVGRLMSQLPDGSSLPWWRVIRSDGTLAAKCKGQHDRLLEEGVVVLNGRVKMAVFGWDGNLR